MGLIKVGELPPLTRSSGRTRRGKFQGNEDSAEALKRLIKREPDPNRRWGMVIERVNATKAQAVVGAIKKGEAVGFEITDEGRFEARARKSGNQERAPMNSATKRPHVLYDVWARYVPAKSSTTSS